jgi:hypothetical protein
MQHAPKIPPEQFSNLPAEARDFAHLMYEGRFALTRDQLDIDTIVKAVDRMPMLDVMLLRAAYQSGDTAEVGRILSNAITNRLCADAIIFASQQRAMKAAA